MEGLLIERGSPRRLVDLSLREGLNFAYYLIVRNMETDERETFDAQLKGDGRTAVTSEEMIDEFRAVAQAGRERNKAEGGEQQVAKVVTNESPGEQVPPERPAMVDHAAIALAERAKARASKP